MTEYGETCSDINLASITDEHECKKVAKNYGLWYLGREEGMPRSYVPTGCYFYESDDCAFWNQDESGTGNNDVKAICKEGIFNSFQE